MDIHEAIATFFGEGTGMDVEARDIDDGLELSLSGSLDLENSRRLQDLLSWIIEHEAARTRLVVDLGAVNYISSTGVGALAFALTAARRRDTRFMLRGLQPKVRAIFVLLGLMAYFEEAAVNA